MIQLNLTSEGLAAKTRNNNLIFTKFVTGSGADDNGESIQSQKQLVDISYSQVYNAGQQYTLNGTTYTEEINHVKVCGTLYYSEALEDYTLTEIALMAKEGENGTEFVFAYGANSQNSINVLSGDNTTYSLILDIIFDTTPNVTVITSGIGVTYSDLIAHINTNVSNGVHGLSYTNDDLKINGVSLDICKNDIFQKTTGITTYDTLPTPSLADEGRIVFNKQNSFSYKCVKSVEISIGDYIYEDNGSWSVGDGTENGALEVIADNSTPSSDEIILSNAQSHFMEWVITNNITKRLFSTEQQIDNKSDIGHSHLTADITDITATASELNTLDGITASTTELNYLSGVDSNIQTQLDDKSDVGHTHLTADITDIQQQINNMSVSAFIPLRQDNTTYAIGDVVKVIGLSIFEYLECIASGITGDGASLTGSLTVGNAYVDGTCIWLCCDMRDGHQVGEIISSVYSGCTVNSGYYSVSNTLRNLLPNYLNGYLKLDNSGDSIFTFDYSPSGSITQQNVPVYDYSTQTTTYQDITTNYELSYGNVNYNIIRVLPLLLNSFIYSYKNEYGNYYMGDSLINPGINIEDLPSEDIYDGGAELQTNYSVAIAIGLINAWRLNPLLFLQETNFINAVNSDNWEDYFLQGVDFDYFFQNNVISQISEHQTMDWFKSQLLECYQKLWLNDHENHYNSVQLTFGNLQGVYLRNASSISSFSSLYEIGLNQEAGLPNITGKIANIQGRNYSSTGEYQSGSLYWNDTTDNTNQESIENNSYSTAITGRGIMLDAKKSNSIYGKSDTVRPKNIGVAMYIKL